MNTAKLVILKETFERPFNLDSFKKFTREFFNEPEMLPGGKRTGIWREYDNHIKSYYNIAKYSDNDNNNLIVLAVELKKDSSIDRARSMQRNFISRVLDENKLEAAIVAFYTENDPSWRLSLVRLDYSFKESGIELDLTPARRYSYLLGENEPNHTAQLQLLPIFEDDRHNPALDEIEIAFSVERVTKDFYSLYEEKYFELKKFLDEDDAFIVESNKLGFEAGKFSEQFAKKLMGQLAFLYFLQKKGWLGVRIMPEDHTLTEAEFRKIYSAQDQAHRNILDKVFKMTKDRSRKLSSHELLSIDEHKAALLSDCFIGTTYDMPWGKGNRTFIREIFDFCVNHTQKNFFDDYLEPFFYEALNTKRKNQYFKIFNCKIPFLNGGLFEPLEGYHWQDVDFQIPNVLFSNKEQKGREADGILDIFDRFNFTINEDEPLEKEVAVDPEMLGKIFENLLDASDRKSKGAFYTPREIVHYMCQESLINYLVNEVNVPYEDMRQFILYGELIRDADSRSNVGYGKEFTIKQSIYDNIVKIDEALKNVRVADPAVGSGAFPLGMLNEIVKARNNITEYIIRKDKEGFFDRKFGEDFIRKWRAPYKMKWDTIKNSIFAVDIEPSAVDIAKLRLWLSVVVEQEIDADNPEPHPLPNLDMNIQVGNSLIDEYEGIKLFDKSILSKRSEEVKEKGTRKTSETIQLSLLVDHSDEILKEMFALQDRYFDEDNEDRKKDIKAKIDQIRDELIRYKLQRDNNTGALRRYKESLKNKTKPYFIWEMEFAKIFKEKGGFDIVIGNPPYGATFSSDEKEQLYRLYKHQDYQLDSYLLFIERGFSICKDIGILSYIIPNTWISNITFERIRKHILEFNIINISHYNKKVFCAVVDTQVIIIEKSARHNEAIQINVFDEFMKPKYLSANQYDWIKADGKPINLFADKITLNIIKKIEHGSLWLKDIAKVVVGMKPYQKGKGKPKQTQEDVKNRIFDRTSFAEKSDRKLLRGKDIEKYLTKWDGSRWIKYGDWLAEPRHTANFDSNEKIVIRQTGDSLIATIDREQFVCMNNMHVIHSISKDFRIEYILALINSKMMNYYYQYLNPEKGEALAEVKKTHVEMLAIMAANINIQDQIVKLVKTLMIKKSKGENTLQLERNVDSIVYHLYGLNEDEIRIIEEG